MAVAALCTPLVIATLVAAPGGVLGGEAVAAAAPARPTPLISTQAIAAARRYARSRGGIVAFAVAESGHHERGLRRTAQFPSASVVKAMLLVARLRSVGQHPLSAADRALLEPMIEASDNDAAEAVYAEVGAAGLRAVARAAHMTHFATSVNLFDTQIAAADQARFFLRIDRLVPSFRRRYVRHLLGSIVAWQTWGIASTARARGYRVFFKGGWRTGIVHQSALVERDGSRAAISVLTSGESMAEGEETLAGIAARLLR